MRGWLAILLLLFGPASAGAGQEGRVTTGLALPSPVLGRPIPYAIYQPAADGPLPVLYLLHGLGGNERDWLSAGGLAAALDAEIASGRAPPLAVVLPMGQDSWYVDDPDGAGPVHRAFTTDLVDAAERRHGIGGCRAARAVGGLSMGGYGAILAALARPDGYAAAISLSGSLFPEMADGAPGRPVHMFRTVFGDPFDRRRFNAWNVFVRLAAVPEPAALPAFWLQAGDDDFPAILDGTVRFHQGLRRAGVVSELRIDDGGHAWPTWARDIVPALRWLGARLAPCR